MIDKTKLFAAFATAAFAGLSSAAAQDIPEGDAANGEKVFRRCQACHAIQEGAHRVGPSLHNIINRPAGTAEGFTRYSKANAESGIVWTEEVLFEYLENPRQYVPGTIMAFAGLPKPQDRADVIAYLKENAGVYEGGEDSGDAQ